MRQQRRRKCRHCGELFRPDPRNLRHQRYCSSPPCRQASKAGSQRQWRSKPENHNYFTGAENVERVRVWRAAHPGYWRHRSANPQCALQDDSLTQATESQKKTPSLAATTLQELSQAQPLVLVGLIAQLPALRYKRTSPAPVGGCNI